MSQWHHKLRRSKRGRHSLYLQILLRDQGFCFLCGKDNERLLDQFRNMYDTGELSGIKHWKSSEWRKLAEDNKIEEVRILQSLASRHGRLWDMDHIKPLGDHGQFGKMNIRTVCIECHLMITRIYFYTSKRMTIPDSVMDWSKQFSRRLRKQIFP